MKRLLIIPAILLAGCAKTSTTESIANNAQTQIDNISHDVAVLPKQCNTASFVARLDTVKQQISNINQSCTLEKNGLKKDVRFWKFAFFGVVILVGIYFGRKLIK